MSISPSIDAAHAALNAAVIVFNDRVLGQLPVRWPNRVFTPPTNGSPYITVDKIPGDVVVRTMGPTGEDEHRGVLQLGLYVEAGKGEGYQLRELLEPLRKFFTVGAHAKYRGAAVLIEQLDTTPPTVIDGRWVMFVSIQWMTRIVRSLDASTVYLADLDNLVP